MSFHITQYAIKSDKIRSGFSALFIADLHGKEYGPDNENLTELCRDLSPDLILCGGDMVTAKNPETCSIAASVLKKLSETAPVFASFGNHESKYRLAGHDPEKRKAWSRFQREMKAYPVHFLVNESETIRIKGNNLTISGLELPLSAYKKLRKPVSQADFIEKTLKQEPEQNFSILLAHNPVFARDYAEWGADLTLCGHYHGGLMRIGQKAIFSPYGQIFPRYGYGRFDQDGKSLIVTSGLGEHVLPFRIHNPFEIVRLILY